MSIGDDNVKVYEVETCTSIELDEVTGVALVCIDPISFLGQIDPETGVARDGLEIRGECVKDRILVYPTGAGSTVGSYVLLNLKKNGVAPGGIINRETDTVVLAGAIWFLGYLLLYALRLPVVYQHGRYVMPAMPVFFLWGLAALLKFSNSKAFGRYHWLAATSWNILTEILCVAFWLIGANTYARDVALIESEMVASAKWVAENLPQDEIIAAHDIGALGYFDDHELIDLAGLISPEVIPFIRNEERLAEFLDTSEAAYLITFPGFYPLLSNLAEPAHVTKGIGPELGGENMVVFHWR